MLPILALIARRFVRFIADACALWSLFWLALAALRLLDRRLTAAAVPGDINGFFFVGAALPLLNDVNCVRMLRIRELLASLASFACFLLLFIQWLALSIYMKIPFVEVNPVTVISGVLFWTNRIVGGGSSSIGVANGILIGSTVRHCRSVSIDRWCKTSVSQ